MRYELGEFVRDDKFPFYIQYGTHEKELPLHEHVDFTELTIVISGNAEHIVGKECFPVKKGDVYVIHDDMQHGYRKAHNFRIVNIMFREDFFSFHRLDLWNMTGFQALLYTEPGYGVNYGFKSRLYLEKKNFELVEHLAQSIIREYNSEKSGYQSIVYGRFLELLTILTRAYHGQKEEHNDDVWILASIVTYIQKHYMEEICVEELASQSGYSRRHFSRMFRKVYQMPPQEYLISVRLEQAVRLLRETDLKISLIADQCGFSSSNYFCRLFHKKMGMSALQYRRLQHSGRRV